MYSTPKTVKPDYDATYRFIRPDEALQPDDLMRSLTACNHSDYVDHDEIEEMNWQQVSDGMPAWAGKSYNDYANFDIGTGHNHAVPMEFIRVVR